VEFFTRDPENYPVIGTDSLADALLRHFGSLKAMSVAYPNCTKLRQGDCSAPCWIRRSSAANSLSTLAIFAMFAPHKFFPSWNWVTTGPPEPKLDDLSKLKRSLRKLLDLRL
jgi:hypothetical protein